MNPPLVLNGSARSEGDTARAVDMLRAHFLDLSSASLCAARIVPYVYAPARRDDDFIPLVDAMLESDDIVFATPVYWYAMGWPMKVFFDRLTDLLHDEALRPRGRALAGRRGWLIAVGTDPQLPPGFDEPFRRTCHYFGMNWGTHRYFNSRNAQWDQSTTFAMADLANAMHEARGGV